MLVIEGRAFYRGGLEPLALGIERGRIVRIAKTLAGEETRDYGERLLLPGAVDLHVHFREPGMTAKEDFRSGTTAAAVGGVTTVVDMPNTDPPVTSPGAYREKLQRVRAKANVNFGLYGAIRTAADVHAFAGGKLYMAPTTGGLDVADSRAIEDVLASAAETGMLLVVHAESPGLFVNGPARSLPQHNEARPPIAEANAIRQLTETAAKMHPRVHIAHVSSPAGMEAVANSSFTAEVAPHHLLLDATMPLKARGKVNPPLRAPGDRAALWRGFVDGRIATLGSDHAPHTVEEKDGSFESAPAGVPGVETMGPLLMRAVKRGDLGLDRFVDAAATRPASLLGLEAGAIELGHFADLVVVDPREVVAVRAKDLHSKCGWTPFEGFEAVFPQATYVRGELAAEGRTLVGERLGKPIASRSPGSPVPALGEAGEPS